MNYVPSIQYCSSDKLSKKTTKCEWLHYGTGQKCTTCGGFSEGKCKTHDKYFCVKCFEIHSRKVGMKKRRGKK